MVKKKLLGFIDKRPLIWLHYVLLVFGVMAFLGFLQWLEVKNFFVVTALLFIFIVVLDNLIHKVLGVD